MKMLVIHPHFLVRHLKFSPFNSFFFICNYFHNHQPSFLQPVSFSRCPLGAVAHQCHAVSELLESSGYSENRSISINNEIPQVCRTHIFVDLTNKAKFLLIICLSAIEEHVYENLMSTKHAETMTSKNDFPAVNMELQIYASWIHVQYSM